MVHLYVSINGNKFWFLSARWHRSNGPAVVWANGDCEWYQRDRRAFTEYEHMMLVAQKMADGQLIHLG